MVRIPTPEVRGEVALMIRVGELAARTACSRWTIRRMLMAKGIRRTGRSILLSDIRNRWPELHSALIGGVWQPPKCGQCSTTMVCVCPVC